MFTTIISQAGDHPTQHPFKMLGWVSRVGQATTAALAAVVVGGIALSAPTAASAATRPTAIAGTHSTSAGTASASPSPLSAYPTSKCYANGTVIADKPSVVSNGQWVSFTPILEVWSNGRWAYAATGPMQAGYEAGPDAGNFGTWLFVNAVTFLGQPHHYYAVLDAFTTDDGSSFNYFTWPMRDRVGSNYFCYTG
jgi:hypothetical protein